MRGGLARRLGQRLLWVAVAGVSLGATFTPGLADRPGREFSGRELSGRELEVAERVWRERCGACHLAFPAQFLPAASWRTVVDAFPGHFGVSVGLAAEERSRIRAYLSANGADVGATRFGVEVMRRMASSDDPLRVTATRWFRHLHFQVPRATWRRRGIESPANCGACHRDAETGLYDEGSLFIPG